MAPLHKNIPPGTNLTWGRRGGFSGGIPVKSHPHCENSKGRKKMPKKMMKKNIFLVICWPSHCPVCSTKPPILSGNVLPTPTWTLLTPEPQKQRRSDHEWKRKIVFAIFGRSEKAETMGNEATAGRAENQWAAVWKRGIGAIKKRFTPPAPRQFFFCSTARLLKIFQGSNKRH